MKENVILMEIDKPLYETIHSVQYDRNSRFVHVKLLNNSLPFDLTNKRVILSGSKPDGEEIFNTCKIEEDRVVIEITEEMNAVPGISEYSLEIYGGDMSLLQTKSFKIRVTPSNRSKAIESRSEVKALNDLISEVQNIDNRFAETNAQLSKVTILFNNDEDIQDKLNQLESNVSVKFSNGVYEVDEPYKIINKSNITFDLTDAIFIQRKHGYCVFEFTGCNNVEVIGGKIIGSGNFYPQTINNDNRTLINEKVGRSSDWGESKNGDNSTNKIPYNGGYLTNVGFGILLIEGNKNVTISRVECQNFNYVGIGVGYRGKVDGEVNKNIAIKDCYCHDNFCAGIHFMHVDGFNATNNRCEDNGHPDANKNDFDCDPGYGIACRNSTSRPVNGIITNNFCKGNKRKGIDVHSGNHILIDGNIVEDCYRWGIALTRFNGQVDNIQILNNTIRSSAYKLGGSAILCDSGGYNVVENNKIYGSGLESNAIYCLNTNARVSNNVIVDSSITGNDAHAILSWNSAIDINENILSNSGEKTCIRVLPRNKSVTNIKNNRITHKSNITKIFTNVLDEDDYVTVNLTGNSIDGNEEESIDFQSFKNANGVIDNNTFNGKVYLDDTCDFNIGTSNNGFKSKEKKTKSTPIGTTTSTCVVIIENGVISFEDNNHIVKDVTNHNNGLTLHVGDRLIKGISWMYEGTDVQDVTDVRLRGIYSNNSADFSLYKENGSQYGNPSTDFNNSRLAFVVSVI